MGAEEMKLIFFPEGDIKNAASRYRVYNLERYLRDDFETDILESPATSPPPTPLHLKIKYPIYFLNRTFKGLTAGENDILFIQRGEYLLGTLKLNKILKKFNKKIIFDIDDAIFLLNPEINDILKIADVVFAGSHFLKEEAEKFNDNVYLIPTSIITEKYPVKKHIEKKEVIIGWIGSPSTIKYLDLIKNPLEKLGKRYTIKFVVIGANKAEDKVPKIKNVNMEIKDWKLETEWNEIKSFDIGVMPLFDGDWERGKCAFKAMQYMAFGIPAVCSSVGEANYLINSGNNGFLCTDEKEWMNGLEELIIDHKLRNKLGHNGRNKIEEEYDISKITKKVGNIIKSEFGGIP